MPEGHPNLSPEASLRFRRHLLLPEMGLAGQTKLLQSRVLLVGAGGLGSPAALYLAAAGIGCLGIADADRVDLSNLQRQILHGTSDIQRLKVESAKETLQELNPQLRVETHAVHVTRENVLDLVAAYDVVVDGSDNFPTRYALSDACVRLQKPLVFGSVHRFQGQVSVLATPAGPCYRCLFPEPPPPELAPNCAEAGVLGVLPGLVGTLQATEAIKIIGGFGTPLIGRLWTWDALTATAREFRVERDTECPSCSGTGRARPWNFQTKEEGCSMSHQEISPQSLKERLDKGDKLLILDVRDPEEYAIANIGGVLIPLSELEQRFAEVDKSQEIVVICHHGVRSRHAAQFLAAQGYPNVSNLQGGIDRWSFQIDPKIPRY
jgi:molybdopterin/thiamine biosynthesis adenylyltransferase/rhodanese-related sulfurtransferase